MTERSPKEIADGILSIKSGVGFQREALIEALAAERQKAEALDRDLGEVKWALFKLDDKPHQSWSRFLDLAKKWGCPDSIASCEKMLALCITPEGIERLKKHHPLCNHERDLEFARKDRAAAVSQWRKASERIKALESALRDFLIDAECWCITGTGEKHGPCGYCVARGMGLRPAGQAPKEPAKTLIFYCQGEDCSNVAEAHYCEDCLPPVPKTSAGPEKEDFHGIKIWWSEEDKSYIASSKSFSGFGDSVEKALKELCVALALALEVSKEDGDRAKAQDGRE